MAKLKSVVDVDYMDDYRIFDASIMRKLVIAHINMRDKINAMLNDEKPLKKAELRSLLQDLDDIRLVIMSTDFASKFVVVHGKPHKKSEKWKHQFTKLQETLLPQISHRPPRHYH
jgi:hypothetical protein